MDYEKNKDALAIVKQMVADGQISQDVVEKYFPELEESEDEKIRKIISDILLIDNDEMREILDANNVLMQDIDAWLKKQGSLKDIVDRYKDSWYNEGKVAGMAEGLTDDEKYQQGWHDALEKQAGQKPTEWSEEDEKGLGDALWCCKQAASIAKDENDMGNVWYAENWLKSRYPQKQCMITEEELSAAKKEAYNDALNKIEYSSSEPTFDDGWSAAVMFFKKRNICPQKQWKPSEAQLISLARASNRCVGVEDSKILIKLLEQLKAL